MEGTVRSYTAESKQLFYKIWYARETLHYKLHACPYKILFTSTMPMS
jgi:hypothetical protein